MGTTYGYMRISTQNDKQKFDRQEDQLNGKVDFMYYERISGGKRKRPELDKMLNVLEQGDTVVILSIDRLSRSTRDLLEIVETIKGKGAGLVSLQDSWLDTSSENPMSDFLLTVMGALAEMERKQITARVREGVKVAQSKGVEFGRPKVSKSKASYALELYDSGKHTVNDIVEYTGVSRATIYRKIKQRDEQIQVGAEG